MSEPTNGSIVYRISRLEREFEQHETKMEQAVRDLHEKLDRIALVITTGSISLSVALIAVAATIIARG